MTDLWVPLVGNICKGVWTDEREADEEHVSVWVREWAESVVIVLSGRVPQTKTDRPTVYKHICCVVIETGGRKNRSREMEKEDIRSREMGRENGGGT